MAIEQRTVQCLKQWIPPPGVASSKSFQNRSATFWRDVDVMTEARSTPGVLIGKLAS